MKLPRYILNTIYVIFVMATIAGILNSVNNSEKISLLPKDLPFEKKMELISKYDLNLIRSEYNEKRIDSLEKVVDSLESRLIINEILRDFKDQNYNETIEGLNLKLQTKMDKLDHIDSLYVLDTIKFENP